MARNERGQEVMEATVETAPQRKAYSSMAERLEAEEEYLRDHGWEATGEYDRTGKMMWFDPEGAGQKTAVPGPIIELPQQGGGTQTIRQLQCPPSSWRHPHDRAVYIQGIRDKSEGKHESLQDRCNRLGSTLDAVSETTRTLLAEVERWCKRQMPQKPDNVLAELENMKRALFGAIVVSKKKLETVLSATAKKTTVDET